jgi:alkylation response protein AidB-like acyl-CoA dehydrogenase
VCDLDELGDVGHQRSLPRDATVGRFGRTIAKPDQVRIAARIIAVVHLELSDEQAFFRDTTRKFIEAEVPITAVRALYEDPSGYRPEWWEQAAALGWTSPFVPAAHGGGSLSGRPASDAVIVAEAMGRMVSPGPFLPVNVVAAALAWSGSPASTEVLPRLAAGTAVATWALAEPGDRWLTDDLETAAVLVGDEGRVDGEKAFVEAVASASAFLVTANGASGLTQVLVPADAPGVTVVPGRSIDLTRRFGRVHLDGVRLPASSIVGEPGGADPAVQRQLALAVALLAAEMVGVAERTFETTVHYGGDRIAFGRPIVSFQAIKHRLADMYGWLEGMKAATEALTSAVDADDPDAARLASITKSYVGRHCVDIVDDCVQITGGIGVTWEHDIHLYNRRAAVDRVMYGAPELHERRLAGVLAAGAGR